MELKKGPGSKPTKALSGQSSELNQNPDGTYTRTTREMNEEGEEVEIVQIV
jgi:hypothetical protein